MESSNPRAVIYCIRSHLTSLQSDEFICKPKLHQLLSSQEWILCKRSWREALNCYSKKCPKRALNKAMASLTLSDSKPNTLAPLSGLRLPCLPVALFSSISLTTLDLFSNNLDFLPPQISNLTNLRCLHIQHNLLKELPSEFSSLSLTLLNMDFNHIQHFPSHLPTTLQTLSLMGNRLGNITEEITRLQSLSWLKLKNNSLHHVPVYLSALTNLTYLNLLSNNVSDDLTHLSTLTKLKTLEYSNT